MQEQVSVNAFRSTLKTRVNHCIETHRTLRVNRRNGEDFVVIGAEDWRAIEETLFLNQIPGMVESIHKAAKEPLHKGTPLKALKW